MDSLLIGLGAVLLLGAVTGLLTWRERRLATIDHLCWERHVEIEAWGWQRKRGATAPAGAENVTPVGVYVTENELQTRHRTTVDPNGNYVHRHIVESVPVSRLKRFVEFDVYEPVSTRTVSAGGTGPEAPRWPNVTLGDNEREKDGGRTATYGVEFLADRGTRYRTAVPAAEWNDLRVGGRYRLTLTLWRSITRFEECSDAESDRPVGPA